MGKFFSLLSGLVFIGLSSSAHYELQSFKVNSGSSNTGTSSSYSISANAGGIESASDSAFTTNGRHASLLDYGTAVTANIPPAPTLSNGSGTYYNKLGFVINTGGNASDVTYAVEISSNNFASYKYVQADGTSSSTPFYQS